MRAGKFQSTPPVWAETWVISFLAESPNYFNPLRPCGRRPCLATRPRSPKHFNPLRPCGRRLGVTATPDRGDIFQSTPPVWAETHCSRRPPRIGGYFNPLRPCGRRPLNVGWELLTTSISIHSARVGGDVRRQKTLHIVQRISIHSARVGGDTVIQILFCQHPGFQSTPPVWAETEEDNQRVLREMISIHSARVGGDSLNQNKPKKPRKFQSTPPVWAETKAANLYFRTKKFQSTPPVWAETGDFMQDLNDLRISIHSARVGGDDLQNKSLSYC